MRAAQQRKIPILAIVGARELRSQGVSIRLYDGRQLDATGTDAFISLARRALQTRALTLMPE